MRSWICVLGLVTALSMARGATAQFAQYTAPGSLGERGEALEGHLKEAVEKARWSLGPLRLDPWTTVKDLAFIDNVFADTSGQEVSDITATAGIGLRGYLRTGSKVIWAVHALPEYVYWQDQTERRRWNGRYGGGLFAYFNRLKIEATVQQTKVQDVVTAEFEQQITSDQLRVQLSTEVELTGAISIYADAYSLETENLTQELADSRVPELQRLDREETVINAGLRWRPRRRIAFSLGFEASDVVFTDPTFSRANSGTAPFFGVEYDRDSLFVRANVAVRSLEAENTANFPDFDDPTGDLLIQIKPSERLSVQFYGQSGLVYSLSSDYAYFTDQRFGGGVRFEVGRRLSLRGYAEVGSLDYERLSAAALERQDDLTTLGASVEFELWRSLRLAIGIYRTDYNSNLDLFDRTVTVLRSSVGFGSDSFAW